jgi:hypothetical protein
MGIEYNNLVPFWVSFDEEDNTEYLFRWKPNTLSKSKPYITRIVIDELNDNLLIIKECSCDGNKTYHKECKHIKDSINILKDWGIEFRIQEEKNELSK